MNAPHAAASMTLFEPELLRMDPARVEEIVRDALDEDLAQGDVTTDNMTALASMMVEADLKARVAATVSGLQVCRLAFHVVDPKIEFFVETEDGQDVRAGQVLAKIAGPVQSVLKAERTALNLLQHMSGVATETRRFVNVLKECNSKTRIAHTRKTTPGLRMLEQQAVIHGGGVPHRYNLSNAVMVKDNHLQAYKAVSKKPVESALSDVIPKVPATMYVEVEVETMAQLAEALAAGVDIILLDNMTPEMVREAMALIDGKAIVEASGNIRLETLPQYANLGLNVVSTSKITLGAPSVDIALDFIDVRAKV